MDSIATIKIRLRECVEASRVRIVALRKEAEDLEAEVIEAEELLSGRKLNTTLSSHSEYS